MLLLGYGGQFFEFLKGKYIPNFSELKGSQDCNHKCFLTVRLRPQFMDFLQRKRCLVESFLTVFKNLYKAISNFELQRMPNYIVKQILAKQLCYTRDTLLYLEGCIFKCLAPIKYIIDMTNNISEIQLKSISVQFKYKNEASTMCQGLFQALGINH